MTNEVQTFSATINSNQTTRQQKRAPFQSNFQSQIMRPSRKISASNSSPPLSEPATKTDNRILSCSTQAEQSTQLKPTNRDMMLNNNNNNNDYNKSSNNEENSLVLQTTSQDTNYDENNAHLNREASGGCGSDDEVDKHHVGPVMGIFFKVWSLVKVTKLRNQQKIRRQNSEDAAQFQYIPGSQLASSAQTQQQSQRNSAGNLLEDRHFRRAGSQPAASSSRASDQFVAASRYQHMQPAIGHLVAGATTGTNSSSSGVSSAASSCLANDSSSSSSAVRRHLSSYSLRRPAAPASAAAVNRPLQLASQQVEMANKASSGKTSFNAKASGGWVAKIKRSATSVNQTDMASYASRYRFRRSNNQPAIVGGVNRDGRLAVSSKSEERTSAGSDEEWLRGVGDDNEMKTSNEDVEEGEEEDEEEEEDSNDIYSTPNDSIQSVPIMSNETIIPQAVAVHQAASQAYPIIKSFSTTNFNQLVKQYNKSADNSFEQNHHNHQYQQQQQQQQQQKFTPIDEPKTVKSSNPIKHTNHADPFQRQDSSQSGSMSRRLNGSRIFISSSSSEDSNHSPANQQQLLIGQQQDLRYHQAVSLRQTTDRQQSSAQPLDQERPQLPLQLGVHYHAPNAFRPSSLVFNPAADGQVNLVMPISLFTPINNGPAAAHLYHQSVVSPTQPASNYLSSLGYRKSPSMMEIVNGGARKSSSSNSSSQTHAFGLGRFAPIKPVINSTFKPIYDPKEVATKISTKSSALSNSISLHDCKLSSHKRSPLVGRQTNLISVLPTTRGPLQAAQLDEEDEKDSGYKLAQMLLEFNSNPRIKDQHGCTALMHAVLSDNLPVLKCLIENGADLNEINQAGFSALDLVCLKAPTMARLEILKFLIDKRANMDQCSERDGTRLLDRLIAQHKLNDDKLPFIDCLLQNGAKLGSSTWNAADGKYEIQLRLLEKLCQDGYFLYKKSSIAAAVYRFEYAIKRIDELEQQLSIDNCRHTDNLLLAVSKQSISVSVRQIKYQTYLGLSRCERKRKFYKRAMEFAHMAILIDSTSYEGYYSKTHILKDLGEFDDSLKAIEQTSRLVEKSIENLNKELETLHQQEEAMIFDGCFDLLDKRRPSWFGKTRLDLSSNLDYLEEAKRFISRLKAEIMDDKLKAQGDGNLDSQKAIISNSTPIAT